MPRKIWDIEVTKGKNLPCDWFSSKMVNYNVKIQLVITICIEIVF